jgi:hypothetical protein
MTAPLLFERTKARGPGFVAQAPELEAELLVDALAHGGGTGSCA